MTGERDRVGAPRPSGVTAGASPEALFAAATHQSPLGHALVELDGTFHDVNLAFCAITGYSTDELVGMTFQEITHPDDVDADVSQVESLAAGEIPSYVMEKRYIRKDSSVIWVRLFVSILRDSDGDPLMFVAQVTEIEAQKQFEAALREREELYRLITANAADLVVRARDGRFAFVSPSVTAMLGWSPDELLGTPTMDLAHPDDVARIKVARERLSVGDRLAVRLRLRAKDGRWVWTESRAAPYTNDEGEIDGSVSVIRDVSEQVAAEQALAASESRFRHITEHASDMIIRARVQPMFAFEYLSPAVEAVTGYSVVELYANPSALSISSESSDLDLSEIVADPAAFASGVFKARHKDGHDIWLEHNASVIEEPDGGLVVEAVIRDITDRKLVELADLQKRQRAQFRERAARALAQSGIDLDATLDAIAEHVLGGFGELASLALLDHESGVLHQSVIRHHDPELDASLDPLRGAVGQPGVGIAGRVWQSGEAIVLRNIDQVSFASELVPEAQPFFERFAVRSLVCMPMRDHERIIGTFAVARSVALPNFDDDDVRLFQDIADMAGLAISNARLHEALTEQENKFRMLASNASDLVLLIEEWRIAWASPSARTLGWEPTDLVGHATLEFAHPDDIPGIQQARDRTPKAGDAVTLRYRFRKADGSYVWVESRTAIGSLESLATGSGLVVSIRDVSRQVEAEEALAKREAEFRSLAENAADVVVLVGPQHERLWASESVTDILGWTPQEYLALGDSDLIHPDDMARIERMRIGYDAGEFAELSINEVRGRHKNGSWIWLSSRSRALPDGARLVSLRDVTMEVEARQALAASRLEYQLLAENSSDVVLRLDPEATINWVSPSVAGLLSWRPDQLIGKKTWDLVHPHDLDALRRLRERTARGEPSAEQIRVETGDGRHRWVLAKGRVIRDEQGQETARVICWVDIEAEVEARRATEESEDRYRVLTRVSDALAQSHDDIDAVLDAAARELTTAIGDACIITLMDQSRGMLIPHAFRHREPQGYEALAAALAEPLLVGQGAAGKVAQSGQQLVLNDVPPESWNTAAAGHQRYVKDFGIAHLLVTPLFEGTTVVGTVGLLRHGGAPQYNEREVSLATEVSARVSAALERAQLHHRLSESEKRYRLITDSVGDMVFRVDDGCFEWASPSVSAVLGWDSQELRGRPIADFVHPDDRDYRDALASTTSREEIRIRGRLRGRDGGWLWVESSISPYVDSDGSVSSQVVMARNISDQVLAEQSAQRALDDLAYRSSHDMLTGLRNRDQLISDLDRRLASRSAGTLVAVLFVDVDRFKEVNDGISHAAGDSVLVDLARRLQATVRPGDIVGRLGGDEFAIVIGDLRSAVEAGRTAERLRETIASRRFNTDESQVHCTVSIGIAVSNRTSTAQSLLSEADAALYKAKGGGRDRWEVADDAMRAEAVRRLDLSQRLESALHADEFRAWFQPIVDLQSGERLGYEALARWMHQDEVVEAKEFIVVAEETGLIRSIGSAVIVEALAHVGRLPSGQVLTINASPTQLSVPGFASDLQSLICELKIDPTQVVIEITEQALLNLGPSSKKGIHELRDYGLGIFVDDFGTGYSSLTTLRDYPITGIKLDRSFTQQVTEKPAGPATVLIAGLSELASRLELMRIAEGVESPEQQAALIEMGWQAGQGYYFGQAEWPDCYLDSQVPQPRPPTRVETPARRIGQVKRP